MADNDNDSPEDVAASKRLRLLQLKYSPDARKVTDQLRMQNQMRLRDKAKKRVQSAPQADGTQGTDVPFGSIGTAAKSGR